MPYPTSKHYLEQTDPEIARLISKEEERRRDGLEMIPSENHTYPAVLEALGSILTDKYSEGYAQKRYYGGNEYIDEIEQIAIARAKQAFGVPHANVQPYSGSPANFAVYLAVCSLGDTVMGQNLPDGGHLTHGWKINPSGMFFNSVPYHVKQDGYIDLEEVRQLALEHKPKLMWCGATAYVREFPFEELSKIADEVGAYLAADIAHIAGLVVAGAHKSPVPFAHIVTTTTHKTLRGPRGAMIMVTEKGLQKDPELADKIDRAVFPAGVQGGPHNHQTAGIAVALKEALKPEFKEYGRQVVANAKALARELMNQGISLVTGGTDNHMILIDLAPFGKGLGVFAQEVLDASGITANKNTVPKDPSSPFYPSGIRMGTPALTTRGMKENEMRQIALWIARVLKEISACVLPDAKEERSQSIKKFKEEIRSNPAVREVREQVARLCAGFPLP